MCEAGVSFSGQGNRLGYPKMFRVGRFRALYRWVVERKQYRVELGVINTWPRVKSAMSFVARDRIRQDMPLTLNAGSPLSLNSISQVVLPSQGLSTSITPTEYGPVYCGSLDESAGIPNKEQ